jgi:hypothetical protein
VRPGVNYGAIATNGMYSVWDWATGKYKYYQAPEPDRPKYGEEVPPPPFSPALGSALGEAPDTSGHSLPPRAKYVGTGSLAMGEIVSEVSTQTPINPWLCVGLAIVVPTALLWLTTRLDNRPQEEIFGTFESEME